MPVMKNDEALRLLPAKSVRSILEAVCGIRHLSDDDGEPEMPLITLHLASGNDVSGWLLGMGEDHDTGALLLQLPGQDGGRCGDIMYLESRSVEAVTVRGAGEVLHLLSFGAIHSPVRDGPLSLLELRKRVPGFEGRLSKAFAVDIKFDLDWDRLPKSDDSLWNVLDILSDTTAVLCGIARDGLGREEVSRVLRLVRFEDAPGGATELREDTLVVRAPFAGKAGARPGRDVLRKAIDAVF